MVEQRTENPRVGGSIPPLGTILWAINPIKVIKKHILPIISNQLVTRPLLCGRISPQEGGVCFFAAEEGGRVYSRGTGMSMGIGI